MCRWSTPSRRKEIGTPSKDLIQRFKAKCRISLGPPPEGLEKPCKIWTGAVGSRGYGVFKAPLTKSGIAKAHRVAFWIEKGRPPAGVQLDHLCQNRLCVEVSHLQILGASEHARISNEDKWHGNGHSYTKGEDIL